MRTASDPHRLPHYVGFSNGLHVAGAKNRTVYKLFIGTSIGAVSVPIYYINQVTYRPALIDVRLAGRINATTRSSCGALPLGSVAAGISRLGPMQHAPSLLARTSPVWAALWLIQLRERRLDEVAYALP